MFGLHYLDVATLILYLVGISIVGLLASRGVKKSIDYFMGGRRFGKAMLIMHAFGTGTHTDQAVNVVGASYKLGLAGIWYAWLPLFVTPFYWIMMPLFRRMRYITTGDFFDERFGMGLGRVYSLFGIFYYILSMGIMLEGTGKMASGVTGGAISPEFCIIIMSAMFLFYGLIGGLQAAVATDFIQGVFIIILSFILWPFMLDQIGGFSGMHEVLPPETFSLTILDDPPAGYDRITFWFVVILTINTIFNIPGQPHVMEMGGSGKTEWESRVGFTYGNMVKRFCTIAWAFIGVGAIAIYPNLSDPELAFGQATRDLLPVGLVGIMLASMIAAVMSSCDSFMVDGSALFVENIYRPVVAPDKDDHHYLNVGRVAGIVMVIGGILVTELFDSVIALWRFLVPMSAFWGIAVWGGIIWRRCNGYGAWAGILGSVAIWAYCNYELRMELQDMIVWYLSGGILLMIATSKSTPAIAKESLDKFYDFMHTPIGQEQDLLDKGYELRD
ncbi:TPA: hypothetical protein DCE37_02210 [Candidatus Latescibacteria bacterium]|nr:hypothetical protein [Candidatus Latescibacterota bacterium]